MLLPWQAFAVSLIQAYNDALKFDPTFKKAEQDMFATQENAPQALALLLPQITTLTTGNVIRHDTSSDVSALNPAQDAEDFRARTYTFQADLSQALFNYTEFKNLSAANAESKSAAATYAAAAQDLMQRLSEAYFLVLENQDILKFDEANKIALYRQYIQVREQYKVGLRTIRDVYQFKADYDASVARYIENEKDLADSIEALSEITGKHYWQYSRVKDNIPLVPPKPKQISAWVCGAQKYSLLLLADRYNVKQQKMLIQAAIGGYLPDIRLFGRYINNFVHFSTFSSITRAQDQIAGLEASFPIFQGGLITSQVRQAEDEYLSTVAQLEIDYRSVTASTRENYLGIVASIAKIEADKQGIISSQIALKASQAEYQVGTATVLDVLSQQSNLLNAQSNYARDLYAYLNDTIRLKQDIGLLRVSDLININHWLEPGKIVNITLLKGQDYYETAVKQLKHQQSHYRRKRHHRHNSHS